MGFFFPIRSRYFGYFLNSVYLIHTKWGLWCTKYTWFSERIMKKIKNNVFSTYTLINWCQTFRKKKKETTNIFVLYSVTRPKFFFTRKTKFHINKMALFRIVEYSDFSVLCVTVANAIENTVQNKLIHLKSLLQSLIILFIRKNLWSPEVKVELFTSQFRQILKFYSDCKQTLQQSVNGISS